MNEIKIGSVWRHKELGAGTETVVVDVDEKYVNTVGRSGWKLEQSKNVFLHFYEIVDKKKNDNRLIAGDIVYVLGKYTLDGDIKVVEVEIQRTWKNGKVLAHTAGDGPEAWNFYQSHLNKVVFRTREEAEKALKEEK